MAKVQDLHGNTELENDPSFFSTPNIKLSDTQGWILIQSVTVLKYDNNLLMLFYVISK